jgi:hypothetical protein
MLISKTIRTLAPVAILALATIVSADLHYEVIQIGGIPGADHSYISAINNNNIAVGTSYAPGTSHAFRWSEEYGVWDNHLGWAESSEAYDINDTDVIVGTLRLNGSDVGFTTLNGGWWYNDPIQGSTGAVTRGINNLHQSVGGSGWAGDARATGWLLGSPGFALANYGSEEPSLAFRLNDSGDSVGWAKLAGTVRASIFRNNNTVFDLHGSLPVGTNSSLAKDINNAGWAVGHYIAANNLTQSFVYNPDVGMQLISDAKGIGFNALNENGWAVGNNNSSRATLWNSDLGVVDLNSLIDANSGWTLTNAIDINNNGWIVGHGVYNGVFTTFVARPTDAVPEPASMTILALGIGTLIARKRKK